MSIPRKETLKKLREHIANGIPIVGTGAGTGISAKFEEAGGTDMIIVYNSGYFRMQGWPSVSGHLPLGDANTIVQELGRLVIPVVKHTPVIAGVLGLDPFRNKEAFLKELISQGFSGIQNFPTVATMDGVFRAELEEVGYGYEREIELVHIAHELDILTTPYAYKVDEAERMTKAGADIIVAHCGCTAGGSTGVGGENSVLMDMEHAIKTVQEIRDASVAINPDVIVIAHGGPLANPEDCEILLKNTTGVHGFYGASSAERLPLEPAIKKQVEDFKAIRF